MRSLPLFVFAAALLLTAHRAPAPIFEEKTPENAPTPQKARPKPKSVESSSDSAAGSIQQFEGTWTRRETRTDQNNSTWTSRMTLVINSGKSAVVATELTISRPPGGTWNDLPEAINTAPLSATIIARSASFKIDNAKLTVRWNPVQISDWGPNGIPENVRQSLSATFSKAYEATNVSVYVLTGDTLIVENAGQTAIYRRVK